jgi:Protein of unknown function (DUF3105)
VTKKTERDNRRAIAEQMRKQQARKERQRSLLILGSCILVVVALLGTAVYVYAQDLAEKKEAEGTPLADLGTNESAADCDPVKSVDATGSGEHLNPPQRIPYPQSPPAFGPHWGNFLQGSEIRNFYSPTDRPEVERLVHSLEHGHTILWYDDTVKSGSQAYKDVKAISEKFSADDYFMAAPWEKADGDPFPSGKHVALTHWTGPEEQKGVTQYCGAPSGEAVEKFTDKYQPGNAPEPGAP